MSSKGHTWKLSADQRKRQSDGQKRRIAEGRSVVHDQATKDAAAMGRRQALAHHASSGPACIVDDCALNVCRGQGGWGPPTSIYCKIHKAMDLRAQSYGTTLAHVIQVWLDNNKQCEICQRDLQLRAVNPGERAKSVYMDHDHKTGTFRGVLCHRCNSALGYIADDRAAARRLIAYLERT